MFHFTDGRSPTRARTCTTTTAPCIRTALSIAFVVSGEGVDNCLNGRNVVRPGDVTLLRPGVWHRYTNCRDLSVYNCCFSSELLRRELAWTREDPLLG